jgi:phage anti-repressor protein
MDRQLQYGFIENVDYLGCKVFNTLAKQELDDYALSIDCAKEISMLQKSEKGKQARQYFIECEKQLLKPQTPQTYLEALKALVVVEEQKMLLAQKVDNLETALDSLVEWVSIIKVSQFNKIKETNFDWRKLKAKSVEMGYMIKKAQSPRFGFQNLYHINVFKAIYPQFNYNFLK